MWTIVVGVQLCGLSIWDVRKKSLPVLGILAVLVTVLAQRFAESVPFWDCVAGCLVGGGFLMISKWSKEALGYGDSLLIMILGLQLGFWALMETLTYSMFLLGVISLIFIVLKGKNREMSLPFVPILTLGYLLTAYV